MVRNKVFAAVGVASLLGTFARFSHLGAKSLWLDEAISLEIARLEWRDLFTVLTRHEANMSFYYFLLHFWIRLGQSEFAIRSLSAIFGVLTIPAIYFLAAALSRTRAGAIAAFLLALNPVHIAYSQEARAYSLVILLAVLSSLLLVKAVRDNSRVIWLAYTLVNVCGVYSHFFFLWLVAVHGITIVAFHRDVILWKRALQSYAAFLVLVLPLAFIAVASNGSQLSWVQAPKGRDLLRFFIDSGELGQGILTLLYACFAAVAVFAGSKENAANWKRYRIFLVTWWLLPIVGTFLVSMKYPMFVPRYLSICLPPILILAGVGIANLRNRVFRRSAVLLMIAISGYGARLYLQSTQDSAQTNDWRGAAKYTAQVLDRGDAVLFYYGAERFPFDFYIKQYYSSVDTYPTASPVDLLSGNAHEPEDEFLKGLALRYQRVFVLSEYRPNALSQRVNATLSVRCARQTDSNFGFVRVEVFDYTGLGQKLPCVPDRESSR